MNNDNKNISKEEAFNNYLSNRRKSDQKAGFIRSVFQVLASNLCAGIFIYGFFASEFDISLTIIMIICCLFAIGLDWAFYSVYIKNKSDK